MVDYVLNVLKAREQVVFMVPNSLYQTRIT